MAAESAILHRGLNTFCFARPEARLIPAVVGHHTVTDVPEMTAAKRRLAPWHRLHWMRCSLAMLTFRFLLNGRVWSS
jgi:predicted exporter